MDAHPKSSSETTQSPQAVSQLKDVLKLLCISTTTLSMLPIPTIRSATVRFIRNKQVCFSWDLFFQNTITVATFPRIMTRVSTPSITIHGSGCSCLLVHILYVRFVLIFQALDFTKKLRLESCMPGILTCQKGQSILFANVPKCLANVFLFIHWFCV